MNNIETLLSQKQARQRLVQSQMKALTDEYMPLREESKELEDEIDKLKDRLMEIESAEGDKTIDKIVDGWNKQAQDLHDGVKTIEENEAIEIEQLADEIKNPEDYANFDLTQE